MDINDLKLNSRTMAFLNYNDINTLEELLQNSESTLRNRELFTNRILKDIQKKLEKHKLSLLADVISLMPQDLLDYFNNQLLGWSREQTTTSLNKKYKY